MKTSDNQKEKDALTPSKEDQKALEEMNAVRAAKRQPDRNRVADFDKNAKDSPLSEIPMQTQINVIHPDGINAIPVTNAQEFKDAFLAAYSDGHGDFGLYELSEIPDPTLTDESYTKEVEERSGLKFNDFEDALEWERRQELGDDYTTYFER
jgi:hypothetical protein